MNITDIDDKIILATRYKLLFAEFKASVSVIDKDLIAKCTQAVDSFISSKLAKFGSGLAVKDWPLFEATWAPGSPNAPSTEDEPKYGLHFKIAKTAKDALGNAKIGDKASDLVNACQDPLALSLDAEKGHLITNEKPFREFARFYEDDFFQDMKMLNV